MCEGNVADGAENCADDLALPRWRGGEEYRPCAECTERGSRPKNHINHKSRHFTQYPTAGNQNFRHGILPFSLGFQNSACQAASLQLE